MGIMLEYSPWRVHRSMLYQFFLALFFGMILICYAFKVTKIKTDALERFIIFAFFMVVCVISPWIYMDIQQNPFTW